MGILDLADYDGKQVAVLEAIKESTVPDASLMAELVALANADEPNVTIGATWLLTRLGERALLQVQERGTQHSNHLFRG